MYKAVLRVPTVNLCFGSKIRKIGIPLQNPSFYMKLRFKGVCISRTWFSGDNYDFNDVSVSMVTIHKNDELT